MGVAPSPASSRSRWILAAVWAGCFGLALGLLVYSYATGWIGNESFTAALKVTNELYAPYVGAILVYVFASSAWPAPAAGSRASFIVALVVSLLWNGLVLGLLLPPLLRHGKMETAVPNAQNVGALFSWLVAGAIGFYFAKAEAHP